MSGPNGGTEVEARGHLSIGEVLALLQDEFPDVTISKIRFLESQGLLDPERTPSGYRKFYEADILRLRWILEQQRDHFLPLKVIKDRLAGEVEPAPETSGRPGRGAPPARRRPGRLRRGARPPRHRARRTAGSAARPGPARGARRRAPSTRV